MRKCIGIPLTMLLAVGIGATQALPGAQSLQQAMDDVDYAELLNAAQLTPEQLDRLAEMQAGLQMEAALDGELAQAMTKVLAAVLSGMPRQAAMNAIGQQQQLVGQAQQRLQQTLEQSATQLSQLLTPEQQDALAWFRSPAHALDMVVDAVSAMRAAEDAQWNQFREQAGQHLAQMSAQLSPNGGASQEQIVALLDQAQALDDATFEAKRATLAQEWLPTILPHVAQMMQVPEWRQQQVRQTCQHLLTYERGAALVEAKRGAAG